MMNQVEKEKEEKRAADAAGEFPRSSSTMH
jgi:hypothetical protein